MKKVPMFDNVDPATGEIFKSRTQDHYEKVDPVPHAPPVTMARPSLRARIENLLNRGADPLAHYVGEEGIEMEVPDDPEAPMTDSERLYVDHLAEQLAEAAPLPDDGLPGAKLPSDGPKPPPSETPAPAAVSSPPQAPAAPPVPSR